MHVNVTFDYIMLIFLKSYMELSMLLLVAKYMSNYALT